MKKDKNFLVILAILIIALAVILYKNTYQVNCESYDVKNCPSSCVVCPPCQACSSISCHTEQFCNSIGFDRNWYENIRRKLS